MDFSLYFKKWFGKGRTKFFPNKNSEKAKPLRIYPGVRIGGFQKLIFIFVHYHPRLIIGLISQSLHNFSTAGYQSKGSSCWIPFS